MDQLLRRVVCNVKAESDVGKTSNVDLLLILLVHMVFIPMHKKTNTFYVSLPKCQQEEHEHLIHASQQSMTLPPPMINVPACVFYITPPHL